jgi:transcriptional regulator with XRE-family HTH domain
MLTAEQVRAARALLRWDQSVLADRAGVSVETIKRLERMDGPLLETRSSTLAAIEQALMAAGVVFIAENGDGPGARLKKRPTGLEGELKTAAPAKTTPSAKTGRRPSPARRKG